MTTKRDKKDEKAAKRPKVGQKMKDLDPKGQGEAIKGGLMAGRNGDGG